MAPLKMNDISKDFLLISTKLVMDIALFYHDLSFEKRKKRMETL